MKVKLPNLELSKFSGKIESWQEFWDAFESANHKNEDLAEVDKLKYLRGYLEGAAKSVIAGVPMTNAGYGTAVDLLKKRYAKPSVLQCAHINNLMKVTPVFSERNITQLRALHDKMETHFRGLETLGVDQKTYSSTPVGLEPMKKESLSIRAFGSSETENKMRDVVQFYVTSLQGGERITIECVVVDEITDIVNERTDFTKKQYPYLRNLWFSGYFNRKKKSLTIQVLIGSDYLWCFQDWETIPGGPHEPVAVRTKLGWVLSGPLRGRKFFDY